MKLLKEGLLSATGEGDPARVSSARSPPLQSKWAVGWRERWNGLDLQI
jgi:hypothetical protein